MLLCPFQEGEDMALSPTKKVAVPLVRININEDNGKGTNRPVFAPIYEAPLLASVWEGRATIETTDIGPKGPGGRPWPEEMRILKTSLRREERRLAEKYGKHPITKDPVYGVHYAHGRFAAAFEQVVSGQWTAGETYTPDTSDADIDEDEGDEESFALTDVPKVHPATLVDDSPAKESPEDEAGEEPAKEAAPPTARELAVRDLSRIKGVDDSLAEAILDQLDIDSVAQLAEVPADELETVSGIGSKTALRISEGAQMLALER